MTRWTKRKGETPVNWLSIDLDYITGDCRSSYAHCERRCPECVRDSRGIEHGTRDPDNTWKGKEQEVLELLSRTQITRVVVRDCHADISRLLHKNDTVYHLDDHDDYDSPNESTKELYCGNWCNHVEARGVTIKPIAGMVPTTRISGPCAVFICLSRPYTHPIAQDILGRMLCQMPYQGQVDFRLESRPGRRTNKRLPDPDAKHYNRRNSR